MSRASHCAPRAAVFGGIVICLSLLAGCQAEDGSAAVRAELIGTLQSALDQAVAADPMLPGAMLHVEAPRLGLSWSGAAGVAELTGGIALEPNQPLRIASNTKTFVAAATLRLVEEQRLDLDDPVSELLSQEFLEIIESDGYDPAAITVRHLLTHTSGLFDYADSETYGDTIFADPYRRWTRVEQLRGAVAWGEPYGVPGEVYRYSDTGYILLGEIVERTTGQSLASALRSLIGYEALGLESTWFETLEEKPAGSKERAHQYLGHIDAYDWDPSIDLYGGGGLVATVGDLARFFYGLFRGRVYADPSTSETMLTTIVAERGGPEAYGSPQVPGAYRMGIGVIEVEGAEVFSHTGVWGTLAAYVPSLDLAISVAVTQQGSPALGSLFRTTLSAVRSAMEDESSAPE